MAASDKDRAERDEVTKQGPPNPEASDQDAPSPPGGPLRSDAPSGSTTPGGPDAQAQPGRPRPDSGSMRRVEEPVGPTAKEATVPDDPEKLSETQPSVDTEDH